MAQSYLRLRRRQDHQQSIAIEFAGSNGRFGGTLDVTCSDRDLAELVRMGIVLQGFTGKPGDGHVFTHGDAKDEDFGQNHFLSLKFGLADHTGHFAIEFQARLYWPAVESASSRFSIRADTAAINRLGQLLERFADPDYVQLSWTPESGELLRDYRYDA